MVLGLVGAPAPAAVAADPPSIGEVVADFRTVFGRAPTHEEQEYWKSRRDDKPTRKELRGAMTFTKGEGRSIGDPVIRTPRDLANAMPRAFREVFGNEPTAKEKTYWADRILCEDLTTYADLLGALSFHKGKGKTVGAGDKAFFCARARTRGGVGIRLNQALGFTGHAAGPMIRVGLLGVPKGGVKVSGTGKFFLKLADGKKRVFTGPKDVLTVSWHDEAYRVTGPRKFAMRLESPPVFGGMDGKPLTLVSQTARPSGVPGPGPYNRYRGTLEVARSGDGKSLWAINELRVETYLRGIAESTDAGPAEYMKSLAVAARTYALYHLARGGRRVDDLFTIGNTANDQLYAGFDYEARVPQYNAQVKGTRGVALTREDQPIAALYFSQSDGRTRSGEAVWKSKRFPYLKSKKDPYGGKVLVGHGTGMSARGAAGFAREEKWNFRKILTYYYTGVKLERAY